MVFSPLGESTELQLTRRERFGRLIGRSVAMKKVFRLLETYAATDATVLIEGGTGTGKEVVAEEIHRHSPGRDKPFVVVDCSALARGIVESELFGHVRGAFTGAAADRKGAFELADGGTIFLDEIGDLSLDLQPKLLRALERKEIRRIGSNEVRRVDVRIIAATNKQLKKEVNAGNFREDLYFRLSVAKIEVPLLRDRREDIPLLVSTFLEELSGNGDPNQLPDAEQTLRWFQEYDWPGNGRELRNVVERTLLAQESPTELESGIGRAETPGAGPSGPPSGPFKTVKDRVIRDFELAYLRDLLERNGWNVSKAAREAQIERAYLQRLVKKHGLRR
jgi:transcriptional regulator with GAF, ATPase, and Fis domain